LAAGAGSRSAASASTLRTHPALVDARDLLGVGEAVAAGPRRGMSTITPSNTSASGSASTCSTVPTFRPSEDITSVPSERTR
jgi:hypothetical protein